MSSVAVVHMDLHSKGGGEAVSMNVLEALQDDHEVTLITLARPDFAALNRYFGTAVSGVDVRLAGYAGPGLYRAAGLDHYNLQNALLARYARAHADEFDLHVSTMNELGLGPRTVHYVHYPFDWLHSLRGDPPEFRPRLEAASLDERLATWLAGVTPERLADDVLLANSAWTAEAVRLAYGVEARVVYPPVETGDFRERPWADREDGFVALGRIERSKRVHEIVEVVDRLRERGHDHHLHVVGPPSLALDDEYAAEVATLARERPYVSLEGELSRAELVDVLSWHRYGIHAKRDEHFGMAVAELAAAGTVPFVHDSGGQREVVSHDLQRFTSVPDAVEKIDRVLSTPRLQRRLRGDRDSVERRFGRERFQRQVRQVVADALAGQTADTPARSRAAATPGAGEGP